jgi:translation initiation factor RLI1
LRLLFLFLLPRALKPNLKPYQTSTPQNLQPKKVTDRNVENLSGGELQRFAIAVVACQKADVYMVDEPSSYLDVRQRLKAAQVRRRKGCVWRGRL